jgi:integrase/recombinase XerC
VGLVDLQAPLGPRDYLLLVLDYNTGLRVSELAALNVSHVAFKGVPRSVLHVTASIAKGRKSRLIPLNSLARKAVAKLLAFNQSRGFSTAPDAPLFVTKTHRRISVRTIQWLIAELREKAGIDFKATPHSVRHAFASQIVENTGDVMIAKQLLGHARLTSTQVYLHPRRDALAQAVETLVEGQ